MGVVETLVHRVEMEGRNDGPKVAPGPPVLEVGSTTGKGRIWRGVWEEAGGEGAGI